MRKLIILSLAFLLVIFTGATSLATNYHVTYFEISTRTTDGGDPTTYIWFELADLDAGPGLVWKDVVDYVEISINGGDSVSYYPTFSTYCHSEFLFRDRNRNGTIEPDEREPRVRFGPEYEIMFPVSLTPHPGGVYEYSIYFYDTMIPPLSGTIMIGDPPSSDIPAGKTAFEWPPVTNFTVNMSPTGELQTSWDLPVDYGANAQIQIRIDLYEKDCDRRYIRFRVDKLPSNLNTFTFKTDLADFVDSVGVYYFDIYVRVDSEYGINSASTSRQGLLIDGYTISLKRGCRRWWQWKR